MTTPELLETELDKKAFTQLVDVVRSRNALALVGAGFSHRVGYPMWKGLLTEMGERLAAHQAGGRRRQVDQKPLSPSLENHEDYLWRAEELRGKMEDLYDEFLFERFQPRKETDPCIDMLVRLPFRHILTTNYDNSIEEAYNRVHGTPIETMVWDDGAKVRQMMYDLIQSSCPPRLVYLHGRIETLPKGQDAGPKEPMKAPVILTDRDYAERYLRTDSTVKKLFALFAMQRFVFFGFSLTDPDLSAIMRQVAGSLGYDSEEDKSRHFAIVGLDPGDGNDDGERREVERRRFRRKFGVAGVFYDTAGEHARLHVIMEKLVIAAASKEPAPGDGAPREFLQAPSDVRADVATPTPSSARIPAPPPISTAKRIKRLNPRFPDDPRKGMFGGKFLDTEKGRRLTATSVRAVQGSRTQFEVTVVMSTEPGHQPLTGKVTFYLHDTFDPMTYETTASNGTAVIEMVSYGAFTIGAIAKDDGTELELDLATVEGAPRRFLES